MFFRRASSRRRSAVAMSKAVIEALETRRLLSAVHVSPWDSIEYDPTGRIETSLTRLHDEFAAYQDAGGEGAFTPSESFMTVKGDRVGIEVGREYGDKHPLAEELARLGMSDQTSAENWIDGYLPIAKVPDLLTFEGIERVDPIYGPAALGAPGEGLPWSLTELLKEYDRYQQSGSIEDFQPSADVDVMVTVADGKVGIVAGCSDGQVANVRKSLEALGLTDVMSDAHTVSGMIPISVVKDLRAVPGLTGVSTPFAVTQRRFVNNHPQTSIIKGEWLVEVSTGGFPPSHTPDGTPIFYPNLKGNHSNVPNAAHQAFFSQVGHGVTFDHYLGMENMMAIKTPDDMGIEQLTALLQNLPDFMFVEPNMETYLCDVIPNEPSLISDPTPFNHSAQIEDPALAEANAPATLDPTNNPNGGALELIATNFGYTRPNASAGVWLDPGAHGHDDEDRYDLTWADEGFIGT